MKRFLIFLLVAVLALGMTTLAVAADCPNGVCPLQTDPANSILQVPVVVEVATAGILSQRQPVRSIIKNIEERRPARVAERVAAGKRIRSLVERVLKLPRSLRRR